MSTYTFRLENVLMVRKIRSSVALAELAKASRTVTERQDGQRLARELYEALRAPRAAVSGEEFLAARERGERVAERLEEAEAELAAAEAERDRHRERVVDTDRDVKVLERLDERLREAWLSELERRQALELDDITTAAFARAALERAALERAR